ncbi:hypothetical protein EYF80_044508 [Liparis tanakae]|uniref:Uncharacterized protein n=1 Tax=Liparis tanakae TaxID=230148 RepID=A0A4Z2FVK6_9TELE|nr:hypothetical protein EYF80_044508 [Liparis tanakae]
MQPIHAALRRLRGFSPPPSPPPPPPPHSDPLCITSSELRQWGDVSFIPVTAKNTPSDVTPVPRIKLSGRAANQPEIYTTVFLKLSVSYYGI